MFYWNTHIILFHCLANWIFVLLMSETLRGGLIIALCAHACVHVKGHRTMAEGHTMATASNLIRSASSGLRRRGNFMCDAFARCPAWSHVHHLRLWSQSVWVWIPDVPFTGYVTLGYTLSHWNLDSSPIVQLFYHTSVIHSHYYYHN